MYIHIIYEMHFHFFQKTKHVMEEKKTKVAKVGFNFGNFLSEFPKSKKEFILISYILL